ncbi:MAG: copper-translocating P-type ATPase [Methanofastidiosum sp.]
MNNHPHKHDHHKMMLDDFKKRLWISLTLTFPILILSPTIQGLLGVSLTFRYDNYISFLISSVIFFYCGYPFLKGFKDEIKERNPGMMVLIAVAITVAYAYSTAVVFGLEGMTFFWELATLIDVMLAGHWIEMRSIMGASKALEKLVELLPNTAHLKDGKGIRDIKISELKKGDIILIKPGEKIPSDGVIVKGEGHVDESMLTGESKPVKKKAGDTLVGGSINGNGAFELRVERTAEDSYLSKVIKLVKEAQEQKSRTQNLADKAAFGLTLIGISVGVFTFASWMILKGDLTFAIERMATVMVITCPHALGLAIPLVVAISTSLSAKNGLLIRNRTAFENARKITTIVFDKTGTLTEGKFGVSFVQLLYKNIDEKYLMKISASLESSSEHPIAKAITDKAKEMNIELIEVKDFKNMRGEGITGIIDGKNIRAVSPGYLERNNIAFPKTNSVGTTVYILEDSKILGSISLNDKIRKQSKNAIDTLHKMNIKCWMLTGDNEETAKEVSNELGLDGYFSQVLPHQKQQKIKELQKNNEFVAMTGDGVNDAPALAEADIGIAIGSGTDVAAETADIVLVNSDPDDIVTLIKFGKATYNKMIQNLFWAAGYNVIAIPLAAGILYNQGILISPAVGAALMSLSTVIVAINAKLLQIKK